MLLNINFPKYPECDSIFCSMAFITHRKQFPYRSENWEETTHMHILVE